LTVTVLLVSFWFDTSTEGDCAWAGAGAGAGAGVCVCARAEPAYVAPATVAIISDIMDFARVGMVRVLVLAMVCNHLIERRSGRSAHAEVPAACGLLGLSSVFQQHLCQTI